MRLSISPAFGKQTCEQSLTGLFLEADQIHWGWKTAAAAANWAMLAGFIALPSAFDDDDSRFKLPQHVLQALAFTLLVLGYLTTGVVLWQIKNALFQLDGVFMPGFTSSLLGLLSSLFNVYGRKYDAGERQWSGTAITATALSAAFAVVYGVTALATGRRIERIRARDNAVDRWYEHAYEDEARIPEEEKVRRKMLTLMGVYGGEAQGGEGSPGGGEEVAGRESYASVSLSAGNVVVDGAGLRFPEEAMLRAEDVERRREREREAEREAERERGRREREEREDRPPAGESGLGLPVGLRRDRSGSHGVVMSATLAGGWIGDEWTDMV